MVDSPAEPTCSFCGAPAREVEKLVAGADCYICNSCVGICVDVLAKERLEEENEALSTSLPVSSASVTSQFDDDKELPREALEGRNVEYARLQTRGRKRTPRRKRGIWNRLQQKYSNIRERVKSEFRRAQKEFRSAEPEPGDDKEHYFTPEIHVAYMLSGLVLFLGFGVLAFLSAYSHGLNPLDILLLQRAPPECDAAFFQHTFPGWSAPTARPLVFAFGALYGVTAIVMCLMVASGELTRLLITANGIFWGFWLTRFLAADVFGIIELDPFSSRVFKFKIAYVMLIYYTCEALTAMYRGKDFSGEKYDHVFNGFGALASSWVLARGFGADATLFAGGIYLVCTFVCMFVAEKFFGVIFAFVRKLVGPRMWKMLVRRPAVPPRELLSLIRQTVSKRPGFFWGAALVNMGFPFLFALIYATLLEKRW